MDSEGFALGSGLHTKEGAFNRSNSTNVTNSTGWFAIIRWRLQLSYENPDLYIDERI